MKKLALLLLLINSYLTFGQLTKDEHKAIVIQFIDCVKKNDKAKLATMVSYPLYREYPLPAVKNEKEFLERYPEIFDSFLIEKISTANPVEDWSEMGWRGIMLQSGVLWLDFDGKLIAVNHQSDSEKQKRQELITIDRNQLHPSLQKFKTPVCIMETPKFRIRIDELKNGKYRYASWPLTKKMSEQPDLVLTNGEAFPDGSGGNHYYEFKNGKFLYKCYIMVLGSSDSSDAYLSVTKGEEEILFQDAEIIEK